MTEAMKVPQYLDVRGMAAETGMSYDFFYRLVAGGEIKAIKLGRTWRVNRLDFEDWLRRQDPYATGA